MQEKQKKCWISVATGFKTEELIIPYHDSNLLFWIYKSLSDMQEDRTLLYTYVLFLPDFHPMPFRVGNFACTAIFDYCMFIDGENRCTINFEVSDRNNITRSVLGFEKVEVGIITVINFMRKLSIFDDWQDYDSLQVLYKKAGIKEEEFDKLIMDELDGTGINLE